VDNYQDCALDHQALLTMISLPFAKGHYGPADLAVEHHLTDPDDLILVHEVLEHWKPWYP
jgi:hypothetical protein